MICGYLSIFFSFLLCNVSIFRALRCLPSPFLTLIMCLISRDTFQNYLVPGCRIALVVILRLVLLPVMVSIALEYSTLPLFKATLEGRWEYAVANPWSSFCTHLFSGIVAVMVTVYLLLQLRALLPDSLALIQEPKTHNLLETVRHLQRLFSLIVLFSNTLCRSIPRLFICNSGECSKPLCCVQSSS